MLKFSCVGGFYLEKKKIDQFSVIINLSNYYYQILGSQDSMSNMFMLQFFKG